MSLIKISTSKGILPVVPLTTVGLEQYKIDLPIPTLEGEFEGEPNGSPSPKGEGDA